MSRPLFAFLCSIVFEAQAFFAHLSVSLALESFSIFCPQKGQIFEKYFKPRKPKRDNQKIYFANPKKCLESISFLDKSLLKSLSNRETISNPGLIHRSSNNFHENRK